MTVMQEQQNSVKQLVIHIDFICRMTMHTDDGACSLSDAHLQLLCGFPLNLRNNYCHFIRSLNHVCHASSVKSANIKGYRS